MEDGGEEDEVVFAVGGFWGEFDDAG